MKNLKSNLSLLVIALVTLLLSIGLTSCDENPEDVQQQQILPESFGVDIPSSISNTNFVTGGRTGGRTEEELSGNDVYELLNLFIAVGDGSSDLVEAIIGAIRRYDIARIQLLTYTSDDDGRDKTLTVQQDVEFDGVTWEYFLNVVDEGSTGNDDGGKAMQVFWNVSPVSGIAILKPYNLNRTENPDPSNALYRIDYTEDSDLGYDAHMEVRISGLPLADPAVDQFSLKSLRMFAGKIGDVVDVYGNSSHPNAELFSANDTGINWAFVASGNDVLNIGVAELGLPPATLDESSREVLLKDYSIRNVFEAEIKEAYPGISQEDLDAYLVNTNAPGFFNNDGFIRSELSPGESWDALALRIDALTPYNPLQTTNMEVVFK